MAIVLADVLASIMAVVIASGLATEELIPCPDISSSLTAFYFEYIDVATIKIIIKNRFISIISRRKTATTVQSLIAKFKHSDKQQKKVSP